MVHEALFYMYLMLYRRYLWNTRRCFICICMFYRRYLWNTMYNVKYTFSVRKVRQYTKFRYMAFWNVIAD